MEKALPTIMIIISVFSALGYAFEGDVRKVIYWLAAALITASVTY